MKANVKLCLISIAIANSTFPCQEKNVLCYSFPFAKYYKLCDRGEEVIWEPTPLMARENQTGRYFANEDEWCSSRTGDVQSGTLERNPRNDTIILETLI